MFENKIDTIQFSRQQREQILKLPLQQQYILHFVHVCGGKVLIHKLINSKDSDYHLLVNIATILAQEGKTVELLPRLHEKDVNFRKKILLGTRINKKSRFGY